MKAVDGMQRLCLRQFVGRREKATYARSSSPLIVCALRC